MAAAALATAPGRTNAGARLDRLPIGLFHRRVLWPVGLGMFLDACDIYLAGGVQGALEYGREGEVLACPWHGWKDDLDTGRELFRAVPTQLRLYPVTVRDGQVYVTVRAAAPAEQEGATS